MDPTGLAVGCLDRMGPQPAESCGIADYGFAQGTDLADVFISYARADHSVASRVADGLQSSGFDVWWDAKLPAHRAYSEIIEANLREAKAVVVVWSKAASKSQWVRAEADFARNEGKLVQAAADRSIPPMPFNQIQCADLKGWRGSKAHAGWLKLLGSVTALISETGSSAFAPVRRATGWHKLWVRGLSRLSIPLVSLSALSGLAVAGILGWHSWNSVGATPTVKLVAATRDPATQALARDLAVQFGGMAITQSGSLRLITSSDAQAEPPQLVLEAATLNDASSPGASLVLKNASDQAIVWSEDFEKGSRQLSDMKLQMALTAARVLGCATDALSDNGRRLPKANRTLYLSSCAQTAEGQLVDPQTVIANLSRIVVAAPQFVPAWRKLLLAEAVSVDEAEGEGDWPSAAQQQIIRSRIAAARRLEPHMAEATLAEIALVQPSDLVTKLKLIDQAEQEDPTNPAVRMDRTDLLQSVGRMEDAMVNALGGMQVDPTSPAMVDSYVSALLYNGQTSLAEEQVKQAQRLWPGTSTVEDLVWRFYLRFGDPRIALQIASRRSVSPSTQLFLETRENPSKKNVDRLVSFYQLRMQVAVNPSVLAQALGQFHREDQLYEMLLNWPHKEDFEVGQPVWFRPALHEFRRDPRFMQLAARSPLLKYWQTTGKWPDFCSESDLPYDCKKEAAKYHA